jgi:ribonuclease HI
MSTFPITVFCDGAAKGNPGPGGWGVIIVTPEGKVTELGGREAHTTNNRMELTAAIEALAHVQRASGLVAIYADRRMSSTASATGFTGGGAEAGDRGRQRRPESRSVGS